MNICAGFAIAIRNSILCSSAFLAEPLDKLNVKSLEAVSSYGQSLAQWAFVIVGGSLVLILGNSHRWPKSRILRATYILFPGAWFCLAKSIYLGSRVQQAYLAYLLVPPATIESAVRTVNDDLTSEIWWMFAGLKVFCVWLVIYLGWSIISKAVPNAKGDS